MAPTTSNGGSSPRSRNPKQKCPGPTTGRLVFPVGVCVGVKGGALHNKCVNKRNRIGGEEEEEEE
jgi:hypothetical protein